MSIRSTESIHIEFDDNSILSSLFGVNDANIRTLEKINEVKIEYRGNKVKIVGHKFSIEETRRELENLFEEAKKGIEIDEEKIKDTKSLLSLDSNSNSQLDLLIQTKKRNRNVYCISKRIKRAYRCWYDGLQKSFKSCWRRY